MHPIYILSAVLCTCIFLSGCVRHEKEYPLSKDLMAIESAGIDPISDSLLTHPQRCGIMDKEHFIVYVLQHHPLIQAERQKVAAAMQQRAQVIAWDDPILSFETDPTDINKRTTGFEISQTLPNLDSNLIQGSIADKEVVIAKNGLRDVELNLALEAGTLYNNMWLIEQKEKINQELLAELHEMKELIILEHEDGERTLSDVLSAEIAYVHMEEAGITIETEKEDLLAKLRTMLNFRLDESLPFLGDCENTFSAPSRPTLVQMLAIAERKRPDMRILHLSLENAHYNLGLAYREFMPRFNVWVTAGMLKIEKDSTSLGLSFNLPLQLPKRCARVEQEKAKIRQVKAQIRGKVKDIHKEVIQAYNAYQCARKRYMLYDKRLVPILEQKAKMHEEAAEHSHSSINTFFSINQEISDAQLMLEEAKTTWITRMHELEKTLGLLPNTLLNMDDHTGPFGL